MVLSTTVVLVPGQKYDTLTTSDSGWVYDIAEEISKTGGLVEKNPLSHAPYGWSVSLNEQLQPLATVMLYNSAQAVNPSVSLMDIVMYWAPLLMALSLIPIFLIGRELGGDLAGAAAAFLGAVMVSSIYWMKVGAYDREPIKFLLTLATIYLMIKMFKAPKAEVPKFAILASLSFGLFVLSWPGATYLSVIVVGGLVFVLIASYVLSLVRKAFDVFGSLFSTIRSHLNLIAGVVGIMILTTAIGSTLGGQQPIFLLGFFQALLGYVGIGGGGEGGVSLPSYASEAQLSGPLAQSFGTFFENGILTAFILVMVILAMAKLLWSRKPWGIFVLAWVIALLGMIWPDKGQSRFVREWWPLVPVLAGVGLATLISLLRRLQSDQSFRWLRELQNPIVVTVVIVFFAFPFVSNAYSAAAATTPPTEWGGRPGLDGEFMQAFHWLGENTPEDSIVAIEWSFGHLLTGAAGRPTVADGVEATGQAGKWENVFSAPPPDYIYTVSDSSGVFLDKDWTINGRRTDVQRFPAIGSDNEIEFYFGTYRDNYNVKISYWVTHKYQVWDMLYGTFREITKSSISTNVVGNLVSYEFSGENVYYDPQTGEAFTQVNGDNLYFAGLAFAYYNQGGGIGSPLDFAFRENSQVPRVLWIFIPDWISSPAYTQTVAIQSGPNYYQPPLYERVFEGRGQLPDFMSLAFTSKGGLVKVIKINHEPLAISPTDGTKINTNFPEFRWSGAIGATMYLLVVDDDASFSSPEINLSLKVKAYSSVASLPDGFYYWRVGAFEGDKFLGWSDTSKFTVDTSSATPGG